MLKIIFLNVGKGNCTIIDFPSGRLAIVDIDDSRVTDENELTDPLDYLHDNYAGRSIFRFILTHPDMDHMSGLDALASNFKINNFWDTANNKTIDDDSWENSPYKKEDWDRYQQFRGSEANPKCLILHRDASSDCC